MAGKKKNLQQEVDEAFEVEEEVNSINYDEVEHDFVWNEEGEKPVPKIDLPPEEIELRELKRRFKAKYGYKPAGLGLDELRKKIDA